MASSIRAQEVTTKHDLLAFVKFPWRVYKGDPNWVPPLISERLDYLNPEKNPFYQHAEVALFLACQIQKRFGCAMHIGFGTTELAGGIAATSLEDSDDLQAETGGKACHRK